MLGSLLQGRIGPGVPQCRDEGALGPVNFTLLLMTFAKKLNGTDPEAVIRNAFTCFDEEATGTIREHYLRELLTTMRDWFPDKEVRELCRDD